VNPFVIRDAFAQVHFGQLGWTRQSKVLLTRDWMSHLYYKWFLRHEAAEEVLRHYQHFQHVNKQQTNKQPLDVRHQKIRKIFKPFAGLVHVGGFEDRLRPTEKKNKTLVALKMGKQAPEFFLPIDQIADFRDDLYKTELSDTFSLYPNMKMVFVVRDPRSLISANLRRSRSRLERQVQFFAQLEYWKQLTSSFTKACEANAGRCYFVRHEDLVLRPQSTMETLIDGKLRLPLSKIKYRIHSRPAGYRLTSWDKFLPSGTEARLVDMLPTLARFGYRPDMLNHSQYQPVDLNPRPDPLREVDVSDIDLYSVDEYDLRNL